MDASVRDNRVFSPLIKLDEFDPGQTGVIWKRSVRNATAHVPVVSPSPLTRRAFPGIRNFRQLYRKSARPALRLRACSRYWIIGHEQQ